jgi:nitrogen-specific signal transduction histidine kinase
MDYPLIYLIIASIIASAMLVFGFLGFDKNRSSATNRLFFLTAASLAVWCMVNFLESQFTSFDLDLIFFKLDFLLSPLVVYFIFIFSLNFPESNRKFNRYSILFSLPALLISALSFGDNFIINVKLFGNHMIYDYGRYFWLYAAIIIAYIFSAAICQLALNLRQTGWRKLQTRYLLVGFVLTSAVIIIFDLAYRNQTPMIIYRIVNFSPVILVSFVFFALSRRYLSEFKIVLRSIAIFILILSVITLFIYGLANYFLRNIIQVPYPWNYLIPSFIVTLGFVPCKNFIEALIDKLFFNKQYKFSELVEKIEKSIYMAGLDLNLALRDVNSIITSALRVDRGLILVLESDSSFRQPVTGDGNGLCWKKNHPIIAYLNAYPRQVVARDDLSRGVYIGQLPPEAAQKIGRALDKDRLSLVIPICLKDKLIGVYLLGQKSSRNPFTKEDFKVLRHTARETSFIIDNAKTYGELKRLDEAKSNFISVVSRQFKTPVTVSRGNLAICLDKDAPKTERTEAMKSAFDGIVSLSRQLDQLLLVLEIEEKDILLKKSVLDIPRLLEEVAANNKVNLKNKKIALKMDIPKSLPLVRGDESKIRKVLDILLVNAINYSLSGGEVEISVKKKMVNKKYRLIVSVSDGGIGVKDENREDVFKKFYRGPEAVLMSPNGFGLGLFIAKRIIDAHGGEIGFDGRPKRGTVFSFYLPFKK